MHFHCMAGVGRTGIYMCLYDMMKNPDVPYKDILARQTMLGSHNPVSSDPKSEADREKNRLMPLLYQYVQENHATNYAVSWSRWLYLREHSTSIPEAAEVPEARNAFSPVLMPVITAGVRGLLVFLALSTVFFKIFRTYSGIIRGYKCFFIYGCRSNYIGPNSQKVVFYVKRFENNI
jgi:hypothetical protein